MSMALVEGLEGTAVGSTGNFAIGARLPGQDTGPAVYEGRHIDLGYPVVIKIEPGRPHCQTSIEAAALARLRDPAIPPLLDHGHLQRKHPLAYLVRDHAAGLPLSVLLRAESRLEPLRAVRIALALADALQHAHDQGVVHGDIKPENVIVDPDDGDRVHLIDFGSASTRSQTTAVRTATPSYAAPEVLAGKPATPIADIYGLGVLLREMIVGVYARQTDECPEVTLTMDNGLRPIVERATHRERASRYPSAATFARDLRQLPEAPLARAFLGPFPPSRRPHMATLELPGIERDIVPAVSHSQELPALTSTHRPVVWVFPDAPAMGHLSVQAALRELLQHVDVHFLDEEARFVARLDLQQGRIPAPWVVAFEDLHGLLGDGLLSDLSHASETTKLLFSTHANLELAQSTINSVGIDGHICLPSEANEIVDQVLALCERARQRRRYHDGLRLALLDATRAGQSTIVLM